MMASQDADDYPTSRLAQMRSTRAPRASMTTDEDDLYGGYYDYVESEGHILPLKLNESWAARRLMEALSHLPPNSSNSAPMRFQQKTQAEQQQRRQELHLTTPAAATNTTTPRAASSRLMGNGKVRQMFDERRRGAGIDRSNPLKPIGEQQQALVKGVSAITLKEKHISGSHLGSDSNNNTSINSINSSNINGNNNNGNKNNKHPVAGRLKPVIVHKTPPNTREKERERERENQSSARSRPMRTTNMTLTAAKMGNTRLAGGRSTVPERGRVVTPRKTHPVNPKSPVTKIQMNEEPPEGTQLCRFCGRHFNTERLVKHEQVCQRTMGTRRKIFDASKQRVKGTDNEKYAKKSRMTGAYSSAAAVQPGLSTGVKKSNWRQKHEEFIQAIRSAKQVQAHLARGGKLSDLPPPPPSENPDYIQCPHCNRRFNQQAAERHIPLCANMIHNKPRRSNPQTKPTTKKR